MFARAARSTTRHQRMTMICEQVLYPSEARSREAVGNRLKFWNVLSGGRVWLFGLIMAFTIYFGASVAQSSSQFFGSIGWLNTLELTSEKTIEPTVVQPKDSQVCAPVKPFWLWTGLGLVKDEWRPPADRCTETTPLILRTSSCPRDLVVWHVLSGFPCSRCCRLYLSVFRKKSLMMKILSRSCRPPQALAHKRRHSPAGDHRIFQHQAYRESHTHSALSSGLFRFSSLTAIALRHRYGEYRLRRACPWGGGYRLLKVFGDCFDNLGSVCGSWQKQPS